MQSLSPLSTPDAWRAPPRRGVGTSRTRLPHLATPTRMEIDTETGGPYAIKDLAALRRVERRRHIRGVLRGAALGAEVARGGSNVGGGGERVVVALPDDLSVPWGIGQAYASLDHRRLSWKRGLR